MCICYYIAIELKRHNLYIATNANRAVKHNILPEAKGVTNDDNFMTYDKELVENLHKINSR